MNHGSGEIPLAVVGCDFRVASSRWRSLLVLDDAQAVQIAHELRISQAADGFVDLNTCNRNEWIVSSQDTRWAAELLRTQMKRRVGDEAQGWMEPYVFAGEEAARHIFHVAIGQKSLVVGERQIAGQLYGALEVARARGTSSRVLNGLGSVAGRLVRIASRRGCIENAAVGVHSLSVSYLQRKLQGDRRIRVALIGLGQIGRRILGLLEENRNFHPVCCNRTVGRDLQGKVRPIDQLAAVLEDVDAAIVCTGALHPVVREEHLRLRRVDRPLLLIDIGIPRQVERLNLPVQVEIADLDQLVEFCRGGEDGDRAEKSEEVESLVHRAVTELRVFCNQQAFSVILNTVQRHHRQMVSEEIPRLIAGRLGYLPEEARSRLELDLKNIILEYTTEVFRTIKETSKRHTEGNR